MTRYKIQNKKNPSKIKYFTSSGYKIGDTVTFKWHTEWTVIKIVPLKKNI